MFERIVVAVDGSEQAGRALEIACDLSKKYESKIHLVHSPQIETTAIAVGSGAVEVAPSAQEIIKAGQHVMHAAVDKAKSLGCTPEKCVIGNGEPADEILKELKAADADLVVMGRRGLGRVSSLLLGSVSQKVSHNAHCTCMTVN